MPSHLGALLRGIAEAEVEGELGVLHPAGRVDPWGDAEGDVGGGEGGGDVGGPGQGSQPSQLQHPPQPPADDRPVLALERHHVGDRAQRREADHGLGLTCGDDPLGLEGAEKLPGHPGAGQAVEPIGVAGLLGVDQGVGRRQAREAPIGGEGEVVVGHHQSHAGRPVGRHLDRAGPAVDGHHTLDPAGGQLLECGAVEPVSLGHPVGDVGEHVGAAGPKGPGQHRAGGDPVGVVIPVDGDAAPLGHRHPEGDHSLRHPLEAEGVEQLGAPADERVATAGVDASTGQDASQDRGLPGEGQGVADLPAAGCGLHGLDDSRTDVRNQSSARGPPGQAAGRLSGARRRIRGGPILG